MGGHRALGSDELAAHLSSDLDVEFEDLNDARFALQREVHRLGLDLPTRQIHITVHRVDVELAFGLHLDDLHQVGLHLNGSAQSDALAGDFNTDLDIHLGDAHQIRPRATLHAEGSISVRNLHPHLGLEHAGKDDLALDPHQNAGVQGERSLLIQLHRLDLRGRVQLHAQLGADFQADGLAQGFARSDLQTESAHHARTGNVDVGVDLHLADRSQGHVAVDAQRELLVGDQEEHVGLDLESTGDGQLAGGAYQDVPTGRLIGAVNVLRRPLDRHRSDRGGIGQAVAISIQLRTAIAVEGGDILGPGFLHDLTLLVAHRLEGRVRLRNREDDVLAESVDLDQRLDLQLQAGDARGQIASETRGKAKLAILGTQVNQRGHAQ